MKQIKDMTVAELQSALDNEPFTLRQQMVQEAVAVLQQLDDPVDAFGIHPNDKCINYAYICSDLLHWPDTGIFTEAVRTAVQVCYFYWTGESRVG